MVVVMRPMPRIVSLAVLFVLIAGLGTTFYQVVAPFLLPLFLAGMTAVVCQPLYQYFLKRTGDRVPWAAGATTALIMSAIMIPLGVGILIASLQLYTFALTVSDSGFLKENLSQAGAKSESMFERVVEYGNQFLPPEQRRDPQEVSEDLQVSIRKSLRDVGDRSLGKAFGTTLGMLAGTAGWIIGAAVAFLMYCVAVYYFLADGTHLLKAAENLIPVHIKYQKQLLEQFAKVVRSVVIATFLAAIAQGIATTLALWFFGFEHLFVLLLLSTVAAMIPVTGTWLVWCPCAVLLASNGHWGQAMVLAVYGAAFVGFLDNVIRTYLLNTDIKLHPLLAFISILGGIQALGLWGVFIGPIVASCLHALVKIFNHELMELSREHFFKKKESETEQVDASNRPVENKPDPEIVSTKTGESDSVSQETDSTDATGKQDAESQTEET